MWIRAPLESSQTAFDPFTKDSLKGAKIYRFGDIRYLSIVSNYDRGHTSDPPDSEVLLRITLGLCVAAPVGKRVNTTTLFCSRECSGLLILRISKKAAFMFIGSTLIKSKVNLIFVCAFGIQRRSDLY